MTFDWTTFAFQIVNFLVLVALLGRFLYRPVAAAIAARRAETAALLERAAAERTAAEGLAAELREREAELERERAAARTRLKQELARERAERLAALERELAAERARREVLDSRRRAEEERRLEARAIEAAMRFAARFLERVAGPELEARLVDLALEELRSAPAELAEELRRALAENGGARAVTARPLDTGRRAALAALLKTLVGKPVSVEFAEDDTLRAGVCLMVGPWVLAANLRDELAFFARIAAAGPAVDAG